MEYEMDLLDNEGTIASNVSIEQGDYARDPDAFGCCSRYRECSDAGKCLIPELDYSIHCAYRKNLEQGQIFYGKKAQEFSEIRYADILGKIQALSPEAREEFDSLLVNFCEYHRGTEHCIVRNHCMTAFFVLRFGNSDNFPKRLLKRSYFALSFAFLAFCFSLRSRFFSASIAFMKSSYA